LIFNKVIINEYEIDELLNAEIMKMLTETLKQKIIIVKFIVSNVETLDVGDIIVFID
jgi:hypothetical protein